MAPETEKVIQCMLAMQRYPWEQGVCAQALYEAGRDVGGSPGRLYHGGRLAGQAGSRGRG